MPVAGRAMPQLCQSAALVSICATTACYGTSREAQVGLTVCTARSLDIVQVRSSSPVTLPEGLRPSALAQVPRCATTMSARFLPARALLTRVTFLTKRTPHPRGIRSPWERQQQLGTSRRSAFH
jgi:hypothetical protein